MNAHKLLQLALIVFGITCCPLYPLAIVWPSGWAWHDGPPAASNYFMMIVGLYVTLGIFLIRAAREPQAHRALILFAIWSSLVHAGVMAVDSVATPMHMGHIPGDVAALLVMAVVIAWLLHADRAQAPGAAAAA